MELPDTAHWFERLASANTVVVFDQRGFGLSGRDIPHVSMETMLSDFDAVVDAAQLAQFDLIGIDHSVGPPRRGEKYSAAKPLPNLRPG